MANSAEKSFNTKIDDTIFIMALPVMEFQDQGYKTRNIFAHKSTYQKEIIEFWELD